LTNEVRNRSEAELGEAKFREAEQKIKEGRFCFHAKKGLTVQRYKGATLPAPRLRRTKGAKAFDHRAGGLTVY
jgi:hypothetical protein